MWYFQVLKFDNRQSEETLKNTYGQIGHCCYGETHRSDHCFSYISGLICPLFMGLLTVVETQTTRSWSSILVPCKVGPRTKSSWCFRWKLDSSRASISCSHNKRNNATHTVWNCVYFAALVFSRWVVRWGKRRCVWSRGQRQTQRWQNSHLDKQLPKQGRHYDDRVSWKVTLWVGNGAKWKIHRCVICSQPLDGDTELVSVLT